MPTEDGKDTEDSLSLSLPGWIPNYDLLLSGDSPSIRFNANDESSLGFQYPTSSVSPQSNTLDPLMTLFQERLMLLMLFLTYLRVK